MTDASPPTSAIVAVGPIPPPINGMSVAFSLLVDGLKARAWRLRVVDLADRGGRRRGGRFSTHRAAQVVSASLAAWLAVPGAACVYVTMAQSSAGMLRDLLICAPALAARIPLVLHLHGGNFRSSLASAPALLRSAAKLLLRRASAVVVLSESFRNEFVDVPVDPSRIHVIANPSTTPVRATKSPPKDTIRLLFLSNLLVEKGYRDILLALPTISERLPGWTIEAHFAGRFQPGRDSFANLGAMQDDFRRIAAALPPNTSATWHGVVSGAQKQALLDSATAFVLPTYYVNEGQPVAIIEALAHGLPVIATAHRAIPEMLPLSHRSLTVDARSPAEIADRVEALAGDAELYMRLSLDAIEHARLFDPDTHVSRVANVLRTACRDGGRRP